MTTAAVGSLFILSVIVFAAVNIVIWILEILMASIQTLVSYFIQKPHDFRKAYLEVRIMFTRMLLKLSFGMLSPRQITKFRIISKEHRQDEAQKHNKKR